MARPHLHSAAVLTASDSVNISTALRVRDIRIEAAALNPALSVVSAWESISIYEHEVVDDSSPGRLGESILREHLVDLEAKSIRRLVEKSRLYLQPLAVKAVTTSLIRIM